MLFKKYVKVGDFNDYMKDFQGDIDRVFSNFKEKIDILDENSETLKFSIGGVVEILLDTSSKKELSKKIKVSKETHTVEELYKKILALLD